MMRTKSLSRGTAALLAAGLAAPALAHPGHDAGTGVAAGFLHPFTGFDHLAAMLLVGLWAARRYPAQWMALPLAFMAAMAAGFVLGHAGVALPGEALTLLSLPVLAAAALGGWRAPLPLAIATVALFALGHGHAHAAEAMGDRGAFAAGMLLATGMLHLGGVALGRQLWGERVPSGDDRRERRR